MEIWNFLLPGKMGEADIHGGGQVLFKIFSGICAMLQIKELS